MARCHMHTAEGERFFLPGCMGGAVYGRDGCTCQRRTDKSTEQRIFELEAKIAELEKRLPPERNIPLRLVQKKAAPD